jgi:hypothetical protein
MAHDQARVADGDLAFLRRGGRASTVNSVIVDTDDLGVERKPGELDSSLEVTGTQASSKVRVQHFDLRPGQHSFLHV